VAKESAEGGLAKRYAHALFELAQDGSAVDVVSGDLAALRRATEASPDLRRLVQSPVFSAEDQARALKAILEKMGANALTSKFVLLLAQKRRLRVLGQITSAYEHLIAAARGERSVREADGVEHRRCCRALGVVHDEADHQRDLAHFAQACGRGLAELDLVSAVTAFGRDEDRFGDHGLRGSALR